MSEAPPPLCDYEGYDYRGEFWAGREYEDAIERIARDQTARVPVGEGKDVSIN